MKMESPLILNILCNIALLVACWEKEKKYEFRKGSIGRIEKISKSVAAAVPLA